MEISSLCRVFIIALEVLTSVAENGFSLNELVISTVDLFTRKGMPGLIGLVLRLMDETLLLRLQQKKSAWQPPACCEQPDYESPDQLARSFRTSQSGRGG